ncbi:MAG: acyl-CoA dehydrogenase, partial [Kiloniellales bacterium]
MSPRADATAIDDILPICAQALAASERVEAAAKQAVLGLVAPDGQVNPGLLEREQYAAHGLA